MFLKNKYALAPFQSSQRKCLWVRVWNRHTFKVALHLEGTLVSSEEILGILITRVHPRLIKSDPLGIRWSITVVTAHLVPNTQPNLRTIALTFMNHWAALPCSSSQAWLRVKKTSKPAPPESVKSESLCMGPGHKYFKKLPKGLK